MARLRTATQSTSENDLNDMNREMRDQPWYQQWFTERGLDPNKVKLNDKQQKELAGIVTSHGFGIGDRMKIDQAGNLNQKGGFAGLPTWGKIAVGAAPVAGAMLIPGAREAVMGNLGSLFGGGSAPAASGGSASLGGLPTISGTAYGSGMAASAPSVAGAVGGTTAGGSGMNFGKLLGKVFGKNGLDPTTTALGGLSLLGGDEPDVNERQSYAGTGLTDPRQALYQVMKAAHLMGQGVASRPPNRLKNSAAVNPILANAPGMPIQVGGALATKPEWLDPARFESDRNAPMMELLKSFFENTEKPQTAQLRKPTGGDY